MLDTDSVRECLVCPRPPLDGARVRLQQHIRSLTLSHLLVICGAQMDIINKVAELTAGDDSIAGEPQMTTLISLVGDASDIGSTAEELIVTSLMVTPPALLEKFSHSTALNKVDEWLTRSSTADEHPRTLRLLRLLDRLPMSIQSLTNSGIGKTANKLINRARRR